MEGEAWASCELHRSFIEARLAQSVRLTKIRRELLTKEAAVPYPTLHRFARDELGFDRRPVTMRVVNGEPGEEVQVDTGWMDIQVPLPSVRPGAVVPARPWKWRSRLDLDQMHVLFD